MATKAIADAVESKDWPLARHLTALKVAKAMDATDSSREIKALSLSMVELIAECEKDSETKVKPKAKLATIGSQSRYSKASNA